MTPLNPMALPLTGSHLIEASAGTGKTFTIALLYLRLVLGPRGPEDTESFPRPLMPPEILVMTFTNAATRELRDRIRTRLVEAAKAFAEPCSLQAPEAAPTPLQASEATPTTGDLFDEPLSSNTDDALDALRNSYPRDSWPACAHRLRLAAEWMDEAAVSTIHSWCHRMLREHAFDSGSLFALNMELDQRPLQAEVTRDYWRTFYYPLDSEALETIAQYWTAPDELEGQLGNLRKYAAALPSARAPEDALNENRAQRQARLAELKAPWLAWTDELDALLADAAQRKVFNARSLNAKSRVNWIQQLRDWAQDPSLVELPLTDTAKRRLTPDGLAEIWKEGETPPTHPALNALAELPEQLKSLPDPKSELLSHAVHWTEQRLATQQQRRAELGPDDLLKHLDAAFNGPSGEILAERIRRQFPVALVDEFQDTDPVQYRLFERVYRPASQRDDCGLLLIGDPKQAIYAFRGADIYTYLKARRDTAGRHVTLGTNFRSTQGMVAAVNRLFLQAGHAEHGRGAFLFKRAESSSGDGLDDDVDDCVDDNPLPFYPVAAKGRKDIFVRSAGTQQALNPQPALTLWQLAAYVTLSKGAYIDELAQRCAGEIAQLLREGQAAQAGFTSTDETSNEPLRPLAPSDLAVLVNNGTEARAIRRALMARGVRSVYLSDKDGVFETAAAGEMRLWLAACAAPDSERALRAAMATPSLGLSLADLDSLAGSGRQDELVWEARVMQFRGYHQLWQRRGVLPMLHQLLADFGVPRRLLGLTGGYSEGERHLTDLLHLGEQLQQASQELDGEHALLRWLDEAVARPEQQSDVHRLRLESDADLVQVVTIHKSKGLEYPLVFLPFITAFRAEKKTDLPLRWHDDDGTLRLSLSEDDDAQERADQERLAEDLRKLYVALTRASHATWLGIAPLENMQFSAIGQLIGGGATISPDALGPLLEALADEDGHLRVAIAPAVDTTPVPGVAQDTPLAPARTPSRRIREHWWIASYSALKYGAYSDDWHSDPEAPADTAPVAHQEPTTADEATALEVSDEPNERGIGGIDSPGGSLHRFPRGPSPGTFLHGLLEWAASEGFARLAENAERRDDGLARRANRRGWSAQIPALSRWLPALLNAPLPLPASDTPLVLASLETYQVELEFWFAAHRVDSQRLDQLVSQHTLDGAPRPALLPERLNGMLKGFIDLVVEHQGRYYVVDWKSNYLGRHDDAYTAEAMRAAVLDKRYDLQYCLYLLALHRLLASRLPDYDIDRHLGGAVYVFLRGTEATSRGVHVERVPRQLIEALDTLFSASEETTP